MKIIDLKKLIISFAIAFIGALCFFAINSFAKQLELDVSANKESHCEKITDNNYETSEKFEAGTKVNINSKENIDSIYIKWEHIPGNWTLEVNGQNIECGTNNFLHEYVKLPMPTTQAVINIPDSGTEIADVYAFSEGELPGFVQQWQPSYNKADILVIATHADDDVLFFGPLIEIYAAQKNARVQVAFFTNMELTENNRCHELLEGLWTMGVKHYPFTMGIKDAYSKSLDVTLEKLNMSEDKALEQTVSVIRRFKPQVLVLHDENGEYGHGQHILSSKLGRQALDICPDETRYLDSVNKYGVWNVPKCYLHLYSQNEIRLDARAPIEEFGGKTALDIAKEAYLKHVSQQGPEFFVDDDYEYSCVRFGLFRTLVGEDTGNDILENIITYDEQERIKKEQAEKEKVPKKENNKVPAFVWIIIACVVLVGVIVFITIYLIQVQRRKKRIRLWKRH